MNKDTDAVCYAISKKMFERGYHLAAQAIFERWRQYNAYQQGFIARAWGIKI